MKERVCLDCGYIEAIVPRHHHALPQKKWRCVDCRKKRFLKKQKVI